jgi:hypothetical protein
LRYISTLEEKKQEGKRGGKGTGKKATERTRWELVKAPVLRYKNHEGKPRYLIFQTASSRQLACSLPGSFYEKN